ncbi:MAG: phosphatidylinositol-specific phospholipase C/glycerophosphodiester phosphodiesterase family protein [Eubacteriales bacterium]|nr:phosphatidylinositol-specific phospholipase C/glycerophosphodiester phosphodiesterase family protein [Eubacteriales bacterium]
MSKRKGSRQRKRNNFRKALLVCEIILIGLVLLGGSSLTRSALARQEKNSEYPQVMEAAETPEPEPSAAPEPTSVPTPEFSWDNYKVIAHALGGLDGMTYLNSKESFVKYYEKGFRLFEVDLTKTSDGMWVCRHSWNSSLGQWEGDKKQVLSAETFLSTPLYGKYTPMSLKELFLLLKDYPDAFILLDSKQYSVRNYQRTLEDYSEYVEIAKAVGAERVLGQLIPEIYNEAMFSGAVLMGEFPTYMYSLWQKYSVKELKTIARFCKEKGIPAATINEKYWSEKVQKIFDDQGILLYIYTVNDRDKAGTLLEKGAAGICTDYLTEQDLQQPSS